MENDQHAKSANAGTSNAEAADSRSAHIGHSHSHGHFSGPSSRTVRRVMAAIAVPLLIANVVALILLWPPNLAPQGSLSSPAATPDLIAAKVTDMALAECDSDIDVATGISECVDVTIRLQGGKQGGVESVFRQPVVASVKLRVGDQIYVTEVGDPRGEPTYGFYEFRRERPLLLLFVAFVLVAVAVGRRSGARALVALALSIGVLIKFILPAIVAGSDPLLVALVGASAVMFVALYLSHGINVRTTSALLGTVASLAITGLLAKLAVDAAQFTGLSGEEAFYLRATSGQLDLRGLLLAGIIIGALGVLDDVTVTQASAVWELHQANPSLGFAGRFTAAMRIGRDHIASVVNTLVFAYAGAALPILLLFTGARTPFGELMNGEPVATEIVRMLAGSIGLMAAVPITTALTSFVVGFDSRAESDGEVGHDTQTHESGRPAKRARVTTRSQWRAPRAEREFRDDL